MTRKIAGVAIAALFVGCGNGGKAPTVAPTSTATTTAPTTTTSAADASAPAATAASPRTGADAPKQLSSGDFHTCALMGDATVRCWGRNTEGQLGDGTTENRSKPVSVKGIAGAKHLAMAAHSTCALLSDGTISCWGGGRAWGDEKQHDKMPPTSVKGIAKAIGVDGGGLLYCALLESGKVQCWGDEAGQRTSKTKPPTKDAQEITVAEAHGCARVGDGSVACWGEGAWGGVGKVSLATPAIKGTKQISSGDSALCALTGSGTVTCWGRNEQGELGRAPDMDVHPEPAEVAGLSGVTRIVAGEAHLCAILSDATARCWGSNGDGELGRGAQGEPQTPGPIGGSLGGIEEIALGADHGCARTKDGNVYCWGANTQGQNGDGTMQNRLLPTIVVW